MTERKKPKILHDTIISIVYFKKIQTSIYDKSMKKINLNDGTPIYCLKETEAIVLDEHIKGYFSFGTNLDNKAVIVDIGANIGVFGVRLSKKFKNIQIHSFEPIPEIYNALKKNSEISLNRNFKTYRMGISNVNKLLNFTYYPNSPALSTTKPEIWENDKEHFFSAVNGSLSNIPKNFWWAKLIPKFSIPLIAKYLTANHQQVKSQVITLSSFIENKKIKNIDLLKIDCEGEEVNVLKGIQTKHWSIIQSVVMEVNDIQNNIEISKTILSKNGFHKIEMEKEKGFEETKLTNIYASKH